MSREWNDNQPIYRQLRDRGVHMILDGVLKEGDPLPSVRNVAAEFRVNPLTVLKAYQHLVDEDLVEMKRGLGMFVKPGARDVLLKVSARNFSRKNGRESPPRSNASALPKRNSKPPREKKRRRRDSHDLR